MRIITVPRHAAGQAGGRSGWSVCRVCRGALDGAITGALSLQRMTGSRRCAPGLIWENARRRGKRPGQHVLPAAVIGRAFDYWALPALPCRAADLPPPLVRLAEAAMAAQRRPDDGLAGGHGQAWQGAREFRR